MSRSSSTSRSTGAAYRKLLLALIVGIAVLGGVGVALWHMPSRLIAADLEGVYAVQSQAFGHPVLVPTNMVVHTDKVGAFSVYPATRSRPSRRITPVILAWIFTRKPAPRPSPAGFGVIRFRCGDILCTRQRVTSELNPFTSFWVYKAQVLMPDGRWCHLMMNSARENEPSMSQFSAFVDSIAHPEKYKHVAIREDPRIGYEPSAMREVDRSEELDRDK